MPAACRACFAPAYYMQSRHAAPANTLIVVFNSFTARITPPRRQRYAPFYGTMPLANAFTLYYVTRIRSRYAERAVLSSAPPYAVRDAAER